MTSEVSVDIMMSRVFALLIGKVLVLFQKDIFVLSAIMEQQTLFQGIELV